eukprot:CAMPEP_0196719064 /NCGR_PEP_ID=MMETSP1091-20130531/2131_1 /TAXON_ID=302021 /ORGANISM="Rhodomonas sp., Strain CCMP768" /LENGTH=211 /DNA_ID=CAMNT_0042059923 /DNA_START=39 /DNA_END=675 /DNA_ORIENTATION=+
MLRTVAVGAIVASAAAFAPAGISTLPSTRAGVTCTRMAEFPQQADNTAPPADLFNIWRNDYMLSPNAAASEAAERQANTIFDGVLPPFSNVGNTERGAVPDQPTLRGIGAAADFSTANPTSAYDTQQFGTVYLPNKDVLKSSVSNQGPEQAYLAKKQQSGGQAPKAPTGTQRAPNAEASSAGKRHRTACTGSAAGPCNLKRPAAAPAHEKE